MLLSSNSDDIVISLHSYDSVPIQSIADRYLQWLNDKAVVGPLAAPFLLEPKSFAFIEESYRRFTSPTCIGFFVWHDKAKEFIGTAKIDKIDSYNKSAEIGIMVGEKKYWGQGVATQILSLQLDYIFEKISFHRAWGGTNSLNAAVHNLFLRAGFTQEAVLREASLMNGVYTDNYLYGILASEYFTRKNNHDE